MTIREKEFYNSLGGNGKSLVQIVDEALQREQGAHACVRPDACSTVPSPGMAISVKKHSPNFGMSRRTPSSSSETFPTLR